MRSAPAALPRVALDATHHLVLLDVDAARARILANDAFMQNLTPLDRQVRMGKSTPVTHAEFVDYVAAQVRAFQPAQIEKLAVMTERVGAALNELGLMDLVPAEIEVVQTSGAEEGFGPIFDLSYTRNHVMYINTRALALISRQLLLHELLHVMCSERPALQERLFASLGFLPVGAPSLRPEHAAIRLTMPENATPRHALRARFEGHSVLAMPLTFVPEPYTSGGMVDVSVSLWGILGPHNDVTALVPIEKLEGWEEQLGKNTQMLASPEEVLAENFVLLVLGKPEPPSPEILTRMLAVLRSEQAVKRGR